jgi:hypothetical protein
MEILKHERSQDDYNMTVKETVCKDGRETELAKEFPAKEFGTSVETFGFLTIVIRFESVRKFVLK